MSEKMTIEIANQYIHEPRGGGMVALQQRFGFYPDHYRMESFCEGFIEGYESRDGEVEELEKEIEKLRNERALWRD